MSNTIEHYIQTKQVKTFGVSEQLEELLSNAVFVLKEIPKKGKGKNFYA